MGPVDKPEKIGACFDSAQHEDYNSLSFKSSNQVMPVSGVEGDLKDRNDFFNTPYETSYLAR